MTSLIEWKNNPRRLALLLRGARQVGKTYLIQQFARTHFDECVTINFEIQKDYLHCFDSLNFNTHHASTTLINKIRLLSGATIIPGKTLLFFDEIQACPQAIQSLRYFKEIHPDLHVIGAGSLLEFALHSENFTMPVGRVESLYLKPLSFKEFLDALDEHHLREYIESFTMNTPIDALIHMHLLERVRLYTLLGGMPAVIAEYQITKNIQRVQMLQEALLATYRMDFAKYAKTQHQHRHLNTFMDKATRLVGTAFQYVQVEPDTPSRDLKNALYLLSYAGIFHRILKNTASGLPLKAFSKEQGFKLLFLDIGLLIQEAKINPTLLLDANYLLSNRGQLAEQWVGQELLANSLVYEQPQLFYWTREKAGSMAEIDYLTVIDDHIVPIEVKAGSTGRLKSLNIFLTEKKLPVGIRISQQAISFEKQILSLPFYLVSEISRLYRVIHSK